MTETAVRSIPEIVDFVRSHETIDIVGQNSKQYFRLPAENQRAQERMVVALEGILEFSAADQVVRVGAGTSVLDLLDELETKGQTLPLPMYLGSYPFLWSYARSVGGTLSMNLPHALEAQCGSWRDWVLGMAVVLSDGTVCKSGSKAVKNVAGFDLHRLFAGARGTLGIIAEVTLRTMPIRSLPRVEVQVFTEWDGGPVWIQRTLHSDFQEAIRTARGKLLAADYATSTLYCEMEPEQVGLQFTGDWFVREGYACGDMLELPETTQALWARTKLILDPPNKLNPREFGPF